MRQRSRGTRKPCHGCGGTNWREVDKLCRSCVDLLDAARRFDVAQKKRKDVEIVRGPWAYYALPYIAHLSSSGNDGSRERIQKAITSLVALIGQPTEKFPEGDGDIPEIVEGTKDNFSGPRFYLPAGFRTLVNEIYQSAIEIAEVAHETGFFEGQQLLVQLATGETSIDVFNKATVGKVANKRRRAK